MGVGGRNRLMFWTGTAIPYKPGKNDLLEATRRVGGGPGERRGRRDRRRGPDPRPRDASSCRSAREPPTSPCAPVSRWSRSPSTARAGCASADGSGSGWGSRSPISGRPTREAVAEATARLTTSLRALVADAPDVPMPGRVGRWLTERFNDWPEGSREAARAASRGRPVCQYRPSTFGRRPNDTGGTVAATGLSADPKRISSAPRRSRPTSRSTPGSPSCCATSSSAAGSSRSSTTSGVPTRLDERGFERVFASGGGPPAVIGRDAAGHLVVPTDHALRARARDPRPGPGRARPADRVPGRELRRDRLRLTRRPGARRRGAALGGRRIGGLIRLTHPFPCLLDGLVVGGGRHRRRRAMPLTAAPSRGRDDGPPGLDRGTQRRRGCAPRPRPQAGQADPGRPRVAPRGVGSSWPSRRGLGLALVVPSGAATVGLADRRPGDRLRLRPGLQGHGLVVAAVRHRDPVAAGLRLARGDGRRCRTRSRSCSPSPSSPARRWPSPTPGPMPSATPRPASVSVATRLGPERSWAVNAALLAVVVGLAIGTLVGPRRTAGRPARRRRRRAW